MNSHFLIPDNTWRLLGNHPRSSNHRPSPHHQLQICLQSCVNFEVNAKPTPRSMASMRLVALELENAATKAHVPRYYISRSRPISLCAAGASGYYGFRRRDSDDDDDGYENCWYWTGWLPVATPTPTPTPTTTKPTTLVRFVQSRV